MTRFVGMWDDSVGVERRVGKWTFTENRPAEIEITLGAK